MLETLSSGFKSAKNLLKGQRELSLANVSEALAEVRLSLLEADVEYNVVKSFLGRVQEKALGKTVSISAKANKQKLNLSPAEHFVGICLEELEALMGPVDTSIRLSKPIASIMMIGLQGAGKTTTTGKLALHLKKRGFRPLLVAADVYRPAAVEQLKVLGESVGAPVFSDGTLSPVQLCKSARQKAKEHQCNIILFDTAGRLAIDERLMVELKEIKEQTNPDNIFLVVDSMIGQDAVLTAKEFDRLLGIDGFILTKLDGDARGGAALSIKEVTNKPIKFVGMGEKLENLEEFRPHGLASRILGMGDMVGLVKDFEDHVDQEKAEKDAEKMLKGQFSLQDFLDQLKTIKKMGPLQDLVEKLPGASDMLPAGKQVDNKELIKFESIVHSMTKLEREKPELIQKQKSRKERIAKGSGRSVADVGALLKRFTMMRQMMAMMGSQPGLLGKIPGFKQLGQMAKIAKTYGTAQGGDQGLGELFSGMGGQMPAVPGMGGGFGPGFGMPQLKATRPQISAQAKKQKRKKAKIARKKNKKRK